MSGETALRERALLLGELQQIVKSMKNLALVELQRVSHMLQAQAQARDTLAQALLALPLPVPLAIATAPSGGPMTWLVIGAERGFCGAFNTPLIMAAAALRQQDPGTTLLLASHRLAEHLEPAGPTLIALPGCTNTDEADSVLDDWVSAVEATMHSSREIWLMHMAGNGLAQQRLWPTPDQPTPMRERPQALHYVPLPALRQALERQALRLTVQGALYASLEQENHWRLAQMQRAQDHLVELERTLQRRYATLRQSNITNELETLASSIPGPGG